MSRSRRPDSNCSARLDLDVVAWGAAVVGDQVVLGCVHCDPVEPGIELRIAAEIPDRAVGANECVLGNVLDLAPVVDVTRDQRGDPVLVLAYQQVEGRTVPALHARDQCLVLLPVLLIMSRPGYRLVIGHAVPALLHVSSALAGQWDQRAAEKFSARTQFTTP